MLKHVRYGENEGFSLISAAYFFLLISTGQNVIRGNTDTGTFNLKISEVVSGYH